MTTASVSGSSRARVMWLGELRGGERQGDNVCQRLQQDLVILPPPSLSYIYSSLRVVAGDSGRPEASLDGNADGVMLRRGAEGARVYISLCIAIFLLCRRMPLVRPCAGRETPAPATMSWCCRVFFLLVGVLPWPEPDAMGRGGSGFSINKVVFADLPVGALRVGRRGGGLWGRLLGSASSVVEGNRRRRPRSGACPSTGRWLGGGGSGVLDPGRDEHGRVSRPMFYRDLIGSAICGSPLRLLKLRWASNGAPSCSSAGLHRGVVCRLTLGFTVIFISLRVFLQSVRTLAGSRPFEPALVCVRCKEARNQLVPTQTEPLDTETHQKMRQQLMSEQTEFCAKVIPSAPPLPESANSSSLKESSLSVLQEKIVSENSVTESVAPSTIQAARTLVQSDKQNASGPMSRRAKLKSVKSLRIDTRRSRTLSHSCQKEEGQYENLVCSQNCKGECAACKVLFKNSNVKEAEEKEKVVAPEKDHMNPHVLDIITMEVNQEVPTVHTESYEAVPENPFTHAITCGNTTNHPDMKYDDGGLSNKEKMPQNKIAMEDSELQGIIFGSIFDNLDTEGRRTEEKEENSLMDKENTTPLVSGNIITERSQLMLKPISSQELMDSISPLNLEHDSVSDSENSMLNIGNKMMANELTSENLETEFILMLDEDFNNDIIPDKENSVLAPGKYDAAISPAKQEDLFPDENMTPASRDLKPIAGNILGSRMDSSVSAEYTSNRSIHQLHCSELSSEYDATSPVRQRDIFPNKENVTPASRGLKSISREVLGSRMDSSLSAEYTPNRSIDQRKCNDISSKSKRFHTVDDEVFYSDKENLTPISTGDMKARRCLPKNLFQLDADQDQEAFCSDKENSTPASSVVQKTRDMSENRARIESAITKKRVEDRLPFQTLLSNSPLRPTSSFDSTQANAGTADFSIRLEDGLNSFPHLEQHTNRESDRVGEGMKVWTMVADTDCLLDDESVKSIMLLRGIKGTHLIIPRIVIRELDSMKQREGLFKRSTKATSILQWIEDCMANESWWIHVQSSSEMLPVAPTPPATPTETQRNDGEREAAAAGTLNTMLSLFSPRSFTGIFSPRSLTDIISPRTEDRVLDCALLFNKLGGSQNMVILSNSVTLKIKAMSEGLLCEGAKEFRETLMNPCSGRFMWSASVPRGAAWSRLDATALAENYYNSHHHREARRNVPAARGLKLILLHNSSSLGAHAGDQLRRRDDAVAASTASACW